MRRMPRTNKVYYPQAEAWLDARFKRATTDIGAGIEEYPDSVESGSWVIDDKYGILLDEEGCFVVVRADTGEFEVLEDIWMPCRGFSLRVRLALRRLGIESEVV